MQNPTTRSDAVRQTLAGWLIRGLPFYTTLAALLTGLVVGGFLRGTMEPPARSIEYVETASLAKLREECEPLLAQIETDLALVERELERVAVRSASEERQLAQFDSHPASWLDKQHARTSAELDYAQRLRRTLVEQRTRVRERMVSSDERIADQLAISDLLRDPNTGQLLDLEVLDAWITFLDNADAQVCGRDPSRTAFDCQAALFKELTRLKEDFVACRRAGSAIVLLERVQGRELPAGGRAFGDHHPQVKQWYAHTCGPQ